MLLEKIHLEEDEQVLNIIRKHWFVIVAEFAALALLALLPILVEVMLRRAAENGTFLSPERFSDLQVYVVFGSALWLLMLVMAAAAAWTHYYLDLWVITNKRVVLIDQRGFFRRFISSFRLERLQDMNLEINGIIPTLLNFGTIEAQTAGGSNEEFVSHNMPDPRGMKAIIVGAADRVVSKQTERIENLKEQGL